MITIQSCKLTIWCLWLQYSRANLQYDVYDYNTVVQTYNMMSMITVVQTYNMMSMITIQSCKLKIWCLWLQYSRANLQYDVYDYNTVVQTYNMMSMNSIQSCKLTYYSLYRTGSRPSNGTSELSAALWNRNIRYCELWKWLTQHFSVILIRFRSRHDGTVQGVVGNHGYFRQAKPE